MLPTAVEAGGLGVSAFKVIVAISSQSKPQSWIQIHQHQNSTRKIWLSLMTLWNVILDLRSLLTLDNTEARELLEHQVQPVINIAGSIIGVLAEIYQYISPERLIGSAEQGSFRRALVAKYPIHEATLHESTCTR